MLRLSAGLNPGWVQGELYIIDVSQAVDLDHPRALDFLREDASHVNAFFRRAGIATLTTRELFEFAVDPNINAGNLDAALDRLAEIAAARPAGSTDADQTADIVRHCLFSLCRLSYTAFRDIELCMKWR